MTAEGLRDLEKELEELKTVGRKEAAEKIKVARSFGDLSENSEYDEAMSDQAKLEARINEIEHMIKNAKVFDEEALGTEVVHIGSKVTITNDSGAELQYKIVGFAQADPDEGKISDESPVGKALIGHKVGETVTVTVNGTEIYLETKRSTSLSRDTDILVTEKPQSVVSAPFTILKTNGIIEDTEASLSPGAYLFMTEHESIRLDFDERGTYTVYGG